MRDVKAFARVFAVLSIAASLALHALVLWFILRQGVQAVMTPRNFAVVLIRPEPPPPVPVPLPKPVPVPRHLAASPPAPKAIPRATPVPVVRARSQSRAPARGPATRLPTPTIKAGPPVMHFAGAGAAAGLGLDLGIPAGGQGNGHGSIGDFDDAVKQRIQAAKVYPPGIPDTSNECVVEYSVTVDRSGQLLHYRLYGCDNPFLDAAARAAILLAAPFPPPPDFGGGQYVVYGSLVFKH